MKQEEDLYPLWLHFEVCSSWRTREWSLNLSWCLCGVFVVIDINYWLIKIISVKRETMILSVSFKDTFPCKIFEKSIFFIAYFDCTIFQEYTVIFERNSKNWRFYSQKFFFLQSNVWGSRRFTLCTQESLTRQINDK